jgi:hypothetical protein
MSRNHNAKKPFRTTTDSLPSAAPNKKEQGGQKPAKATARQNDNTTMSRNHNAKKPFRTTTDSLPSAAPNKKVQFKGQFKGPSKPADSFTRAVATVRVWFDRALNSYANVSTDSIISLCTLLHAFLNPFPEQSNRTRPSS